jgi:hypothetical protein
MKRWNLFVVSVFGVVFASFAFAGSYESSRTSEYASGQLRGRVGMCWTDTSAASSTSTSSPTSNYGIVFSIESGNGNEIAANIYSLDSNLRKIKQVGHADTTASGSASSFTFTNASDSPSQFALTITPQDYSSGQPRDEGWMSGELTNATLFTGDTVTGVVLKCEVADLNRLPTPTASGSPTPSPTASTSPTPNPSQSSSPTPAPSPTSSATTLP